MKRRENKMTLLLVSDQSTYAPEKHRNAYRPYKISEEPLNL